VVSLVTTDRWLGKDRLIMRQPPTCSLVTADWQFSNSCRVVWQRRRGGLVTVI